MESGEGPMWSTEVYSIHDVVYKLGLPQTLIVSEGLYSEEDDECLSTGDVIRLDSVDEVRRVISEVISVHGDLLTTLKLPLNDKSLLYVKHDTATTQYKSVQELIQLFPGYVHVDSPIRVALLDGANNQCDVDLRRGSCLKLDRVMKGQGLQCTYKGRQVCLRCDQRGRFSRIPKPDIMTLNDVIRNFSLPVKVRYIDELPLLGCAVDSSDFDYLSLECVDPVVAIVGYHLSNENSNSKGENQFTLPLKQAKDVEVQIRLVSETNNPRNKSSQPTTKNHDELEAASQNFRSPQAMRNLNNPDSKSRPRNPEAVLRKAGPQTPQKKCPLPPQRTSSLPRQKPIIPITPSSPNGSLLRQVSGNDQFLTVIEDMHKTRFSDPPKKTEASNPSVPDLPPRTRTRSNEKLCQVPPLPVRSKKEYESCGTFKIKKTDVGDSNKDKGLVIKRLDQEVGKKLFSDNQPKQSLAKPMKKTPSSENVNDSEEEECDYITMGRRSQFERACKKEQKKKLPPVPVKTDQKSNQIKAFPPMPVKVDNKSSEVKQRPPPPIRGDNKAVLLPKLMPSNAESIQVNHETPVREASSVQCERRIVPKTDDRICNVVKPNNSMMTGVGKDKPNNSVMTGVGYSSGRVESQHMEYGVSVNIDEYYSSIPQDFRKSLMLVHKELYCKTMKPMETVHPFSRSITSESKFQALSVIDTARCFRECRLYELADLCEREGLDGGFIDRLSPQQLCDKPFSLSKLHRMKLEQIKQGWRPLYE